MNDITYIGITNYQNIQVRFGIKEKDRGGHIYCIGKTGSGKSTLLLNMAISDIKNNKGFGIIDPHGDISEAILNYIPKERITDVIYFNGSDVDFPIAFNPLHDIPSNNHHLVASNIVGTFKKVWSESWGPRLEHILRNSILTLLQYPHASLLDIQPLLTDYVFRSEVLHHITDIGLRNFWLKEFNTMPPPFRAEAIAPVINKVGMFQTHPILRTVFGQQTSSFSIADIMNQHKIFIVNLSKGTLGEDCTQLLGSLLITQFQTAALGRTKQPIETRTPFYLYIDEMHSFITLSFADILAESRKYGLSLFLAHQYIEQLSDPIRAAIFGNVGTLISFRIGATDAVTLEQEFSPIFTREDLVNLPRYAMYIKLLIDGTTSAPFSANSLPLPAVGDSWADDIIMHSRNTYATDRKVVEHQLQQRYKEALHHKEQSLFG